MKTAFAIRHVSFEDLGVWEPLLRERGYDVRYHDIGLDSRWVEEALQADLLVVLGGPISALDEARYPFLLAELEVIQQRITAGYPTLGICLGAQLIARAMGAFITAMTAREIGFDTLTLTAAGRASFMAPLDNMPVLHWHGDEFEIPAQAAALAVSPRCYRQAFCPGEPHACLAIPLGNRWHAYRAMADRPCL
ncbi:GMP synthase (glutamine-hydrolysing) [Modicisalibacter muralis]|uniref:GMP synthase (Glutamine-hydrolysing) n=1 Tax=Modicisalibacter muralis TaxID=119000 RepID=A0A1G9LJK7_9GAMM|nr:glutamine amidotransferase [Halomonas muralis]SDL62086.1 GMP synthase (glutamine-hydrolysing) [Halomonas muralis]